MTPLGLSTPATIALVAGVVVGLAFVAALIVMTLRRRGPQAPAIPEGMRPGPADEVLERRHVDRNMAWGVIFLAIVAVWLPTLWLREPNQNVADAVELVDRSVERGEMWFQVASEENPTGFGCAQCHGEQAEGGAVPFTTPDGTFVPDYPVPPLRDVCGGSATGHPQIQEFEDITRTIMEGRPGTPMPSWSVRFAGPMNDQQIQDIVNYLIEINREHVPQEQNLCTNPAAGAGAEEPTPGPTTSVTPGVPSDQGQDDEQPEGATPTPEDQG